MSGGYRSLVGFWLGGVSSPQGAPSATGGYRSLVAPWVGGMSSPSAAPPAQGGHRSLLAFWMGGLSANPATPEIDTRDVSRGSYRRHRRRLEELMRVSERHLIEKYEKQGEVRRAIDLARSQLQSLEELNTETQATILKTTDHAVQANSIIHEIRTELNAARAQLQNLVSLIDEEEDIHALLLFSGGF